MRSTHSPQYLSTQEVGKRLGYSSGVIRDLIAEGRLRGAQRADGRWVVAETELVRFTRACVRAQGREARQ